MKKLALSLLAFCFLTSPAFAQDKKETAYERVVSSGAIRCGYLPWPPFIEKDANTGAISGLANDVTQAVARALEFKVEMSFEYSLATYLEDLNSNKFDLECAGGWPNALRGKKVLYTQPYAYFPMVAVAQASDKRSENDLAWINDGAVKVAVMDGETSVLIQKEQFPKSTVLSIPQQAGGTDLLMQVATGKADVTFTDAASAKAFDAANPGKIRVLYGHPVRVIPLNFSLAVGEDRFVQVLNTAIDQLLHDGALDTILNKYDPNHKTLKRVSKGYE